MSRMRWRPVLAVRQRIVAIVLAGAALFYFLFDPLSSPFMPQCAFRHFTGLSCPGCGSQRVVHHLLHGEVAEAFHANALLVIILPLLIFMLWLETQRKRRQDLYRRFYSLPMIIGWAMVLIGWGVARNVWGM